MYTIEDLKFQQLKEVLLTIDLLKDLFFKLAEIQKQLTECLTEGKEEQGETDKALEVISEITNVISRTNPLTMSIVISRVKNETRTMMGKLIPRNACDGGKQSYNK